MSEISDFVTLLQSIHLPSCFNPYSQIDTEVDLPHADRIRSKNLELYLEDMNIQSPQTMWVGEALGYRGGKCSGLPFTDTYQLTQSPSSYSMPTSNPREESTARSVHGVIDNLDSLPLFWNIFPFHPYRGQNFQSNRQPTAAEIKIGYGFFQELNSIFDIHAIYAIGKKAHRELKRNGIESTYIRHPSRGGANIFRQTISYQ